MKTFKTIRMGFLAAAAALVCFSSCSSDDDQKGGGNPAPQRESRGAHYQHRQDDVSCWRNKTNDQIDRQREAYRGPYSRYFR